MLTQVTLGPSGYNQVPVSTAPEKSKCIHIHTETHPDTQTTSLFLTSLTPGWQESSESLKWRSTAAHSSKKQLQTKSKLLSILMMFGHKQSKEEEEEEDKKRKKKKLSPLSQHTQSQPNHPPWQRETCKSCYEWVPTAPFPLQNAT